MRALHRDIGFLTLGLTIVYALSGVLLIYRTTDFMKIDRTEELQLEKNLSADDLGGKLRIRGFKAERQEDSVIYFAQGFYDAEAGKATVSRKVYVPPFDKLVALHKITERNKVSPITAVYGLMLFFMAISSLFMFKFKSKRGRRGLVLTVVGLAATVLIILLL